MSLWRYAVASGLPWYVLSAKFGLLAPDDVIGPYDVYLADQSPDYKKAWGEFVAAQLEQRERLRQSPHFWADSLRILTATDLILSSNLPLHR